MSDSDTDGLDLAAHYKLLQTRFDPVAKTYDMKYGPPSGSRPGNPLVCWLRDEHLAQVRGLVKPGGALLDLGCGTGEEALQLVQDGYSVLGIDVSGGMVWQAQAKAASLGLRRGVIFRALPAGQIGDLDERGPFQGAYASLGTLNTEPDLAGVARGLSALLEPGAPFIVTVMNRRCLFERLRRLRSLGGTTMLDRPAAWTEGRAGATGVTAPVRFYAPGEFAAALAPYFIVESVIAFPLWLPPVHLQELYREREAAYKQMEARERRMRSWPVLRNRGDHFLMVLRRTEAEIAADAGPQPTNRTE